jgi:rare lipoprotein A
MTSPDKAMNKARPLTLAVALAIALWGAGCARQSRPDERGAAPPPASDLFFAEGLASYYGKGFAGRPTANGEIFNPRAMTAAHKKLPFSTCVRVENVANGKEVTVRINDRGPFVGDRIIDLSEGAAQKLDMLEKGLAKVRLFRCRGS